MNRIGIMLEISEDMLGDWVKTTPMLQVIDSDPNSLYSVTALLVNELESRQRVLARDDIDAAIAELAQQLTFFDEEE